MTILLLNKNNNKISFDSSNLTISVTALLFRHSKLFLMLLLLMISICVVSLRSISQRELGIYIENVEIFNKVKYDEPNSSNKEHDSAIVHNDIHSTSANDTTQSNMIFNNLCDGKEESSPIKVASTHNKTLVILIGSLRGGEPAWRSLYRQVLDVNHADLALLIGEKRGDRNIYPNNSTLHDRAKYLWVFKEPVGDWSDELFEMFDDMEKEDPSLLGVDWKKRFQKLQNSVVVNYTGLFGPIEGKRGSGAIIFIIRHWLSKKIKELDLVNVYERFVISRSDHYYKCAHDLSNLSNDKVWVPTGQDYRGITDRHVVVNNRHVLMALDIYPALFRNPTPYLRILRRMNPERLINAVWRQHCLLPNHVDRFPRMMFTCGSSGDETRWKKYIRNATIDKHLIQLKYGAEYHESSRNCRNKNG